MNLKLDTSSIRNQLKNLKQHIRSKQKVEVRSEERAAEGVSIETPIQFQTTKMDIQNEIIQETISSSVNLLRRSEESQIANNGKYFCIRKTSIVVAILFFIKLLNHIDRFTVAGM